MNGMEKERPSFVKRAPFQIKLTEELNDERGAEQRRTAKCFITRRDPNFLTPRPFDSEAEGEPSVSDSRAYLQSGLRGIKVVAATSSVEISTESQTVADYKKDNAKPAAPQQHP